MHVLADEIVEISPAMEKFFGCAGRMLKPCPASVAALIREVPKGKVTTFDRLRSELARQHHVEVACPYDTRQALRAIASEPHPVATWRVVKKNGELLKYLPGGTAQQAEQLRNEGVAVTGDATGAKVDKLKAHLVSFR